MIGSSPVCQATYDLVRRVASLDASVLITGESGTGKELIARPSTILAAEENIHSSQSHAEPSLRH